MQCYGPSRRCVEEDLFTLTLGDDATVRDAVAAMATMSDDFAHLLPHCAIAVGDEIVPRTHVLHSGDALSVLPPVNGG